MVLGATRQQGRGVSRKGNQQEERKSSRKISQYTSRTGGKLRVAAHEGGGKCANRICDSVFESIAPSNEVDRHRNEHLEEIGRDGAMFDEDRAEKGGHWANDSVGCLDGAKNLRPP